MQETLKNML